MYFKFEFFPAFRKYKILQVVTLKEAKLLLKEDDDLIIAVYDYWLNKRLRTVSFYWGSQVLWNHRNVYRSTESSLAS